MRRSIVLGCGSYLPARVMTNDELATRIDTSDEWIRQRTGIRQRHIAAEGELTSDLALRAAQEALANAGVEPHEEIGRAHVLTPVTNAHLVCRLLLEKKKNQKRKTLHK